MQATSNMHLMGIDEAEQLGDYCSCMPTDLSSAISCMSFSLSPSFSRDYDPMMQQHRPESYHLKLDDNMR